MNKQTEALKLALEGAANYIDALGGDSRKYRQALAEQPAVSAGPITPSMMQGPTPEQKSQMVAAMSKLAEQPAQQCGLEMVDDEGENQAVRMFLALYGGQRGITTEQMRKNLKMAGFDGAWPEWANTHNGHLTKAGAQLWIRHLFALEQPAQPAQQQEPVAWRWSESGSVRWFDWTTDWSHYDRAKAMGFPIQYAAPQAQRKPLTDEQKAILKECRNQAMKWVTQARITECGAFSGIAQDLDWLCNQLVIEAAHGIKENT